MEENVPTDLEVLLAYECLVGLEYGRIKALLAMFKAYNWFDVKGFKDEWLYAPIPISVFNWEAHPEGVYADQVVWSNNENGEEE